MTRQRWEDGNEDTRYCRSTERGCAFWPDDRFAYCRKCGAHAGLHVLNPSRPPVPEPLIDAEIKQAIEQALEARA